jgi:hypothetical protein
MTGPPENGKGGAADAANPGCFGNCDKDSVNRRRPKFNYRDHAECAELVKSSLHTSVRQVWWNQRRHGARLPAQRGVIVLDGGLQ